MGEYHTQYIRSMFESEEDYHAYLNRKLHIQWKSSALEIFSGLYNLEEFIDQQTAIEWVAKKAILDFYVELAKDGLSADDVPQMKAVVSLLNAVSEQDKENFMRYFNAYALTVEKQRMEQEGKNRRAAIPARNEKEGIFIPKKAIIGCVIALILVAVVLLAVKMAGNSPDREVKGSGGTSQQPDIKKQDGTFIASKNSDRFHQKSCTYAQKISEANCIYFDTEEEAVRSGRRKCEVCFFSYYHPPVMIYSGRIVTSPSGECVAPLSVTTMGDQNYYIVLDGTDKMSFYVMGGGTVDIDVPLGLYEIYYATGETWYGQEYKFGPETRFYKCEDFFRFYEDDGYVNGWTLELYLQSNGNMSTNPIDMEEFPDI